MLDNYGEIVPDDLVALTCGIDRFADEELKVICNARWYEVWHKWGTDLAVSFAEVDGLIDEPLGDTPIEVLRINEVLKRWSIEDGFYSA